MNHVLPQLSLKGEIPTHEQPMKDTSSETYDHLACSKEKPFKILKTGILA
jgi:hypothetical protein